MRLSTHRIMEVSRPRRAVSSHPWRGIGIVIHSASRLVAFTSFPRANLKCWSDKNVWFEVGLNQIRSVHARDDWISSYMLSFQGLFFCFLTPLTHDRR